MLMKQQSTMATGINEKQTGLMNLKSDESQQSIPELQISVEQRCDASKHGSTRNTKQGMHIHN
jgi:hypothetical protein